MNRIDGAGHIGNMFVAEDSAISRPPTEITAGFLNGVQEELIAVIVGADLIPAAGDNTQLRQAIAKMIRGGQRAVVIGGVTFGPAVTLTGKAVYWDAANARFDLALADGTAKQNCLGFADVPNGNVYAFGNAVLFAGLTPGARYYLDAATPGLVTSVAPANAVFVGIARSATELFVDIDALPTANATAIQGTFKNLKIDSLGINNYNCVITADEVILENVSNQYMAVRAVNKTIAANGVVGAPLSVMSARAVSTWYYRWLWYNAALGLTATLDLSSTAPTPPTGYAASDFKAPLPGACRTDASGGTYLLPISTRGRRSQYVVTADSNLTAYPVIFSGSNGAVLTATGVSSVVPPNAASIKVLSGFSSMSSANTTIFVCANAAGSFGNSLGGISQGGSGSIAGLIQSNILLESQNIYISSNSGVGIVNVNGWEDNL